MAEVDFVLNEAIEKNNLNKSVKSFLYSAFITLGPWIITIIAVSFLAIFSMDVKFSPSISLFKVITVYNFAFSVVLTAPIAVVVTKYLSDIIYGRKFEKISATLFGSLFFTFLISTPIAIWFYGFKVNLGDIDAFFAAGNFVLLCLIWVVMVFLSTIKGYRSILLSFFLGLILLFAISVLLSPLLKTTGFLFGMNVGLTLVLVSLSAMVIPDYPFKAKEMFGFLKYFGLFWDIALAELFAVMAIWSDKWVMWFAKNGAENMEGFVFNPSYDSAMFLSYVSILPLSILFFVFIEVSFFKEYRKFVRVIVDHSSLQEIKDAEERVIKLLLEGLRNSLILQGILSVVIVFGAVGIFKFIGADYEIMNIFQMGVLGVLFQALALFIVAFFSYFNLNKEKLLISFIFLISNIGFTYYFMEKGEAYYGVGYLLSSVITFMMSFIIFWIKGKDISYFIFMKNGKAVNVR